MGSPIKEAYPGSPILIVGFSTLPQVGASWHTIDTKKKAEEEVKEFRSSISPARALEGARPSLTLASQNAGSEPSAETSATEEEKDIIVLPLVIKTDVAGMGEAVVHELEKIKTGDKLQVKIVSQGTGAINQDDVRMVGSGKMPGLVVGFNVKIDAPAKDLAERQGVEVGLFDVIYELTKWLGDEIEKRRPRERNELVTAAAKIIKVFSTQGGKTVLGGRVEAGELEAKASVRIMREDAEVGTGEIESLQSGKVAVKKVEKGDEFGAMVKSDVEIKNGDRLESFDVTFV